MVKKRVATPMATLRRRTHGRNGDRPFGVTSRSRMVLHEAVLKTALHEAVNTPHRAKASNGQDKVRLGNRVLLSKVESSSRMARLQSGRMSIHGAGRLASMPRHS